MELATGQNVRDDMLARVLSWEHQPFPERDALTIAWHLAQALKLAHDAGICYDDMKLDNLFWDDQRPQPLRIIDWNVTSSVQERGGVSGDWARFGARLLELLTGMPLGVDAQDMLVSGRPEDAPTWSRLPYGIQRIIQRALHPQMASRYQQDAAILADLERERQALDMDAPALLEQTRAALERNSYDEARAWLSRAQRHSPTIRQSRPC